MKRFGLKTLLLVVTLIAVGLIFYPKIRRYVKWHETREKLVVWSENLKRENGNIESYWHMDLRFADSNSGVDLVGSSLTVLTGEPTKTVSPDGSLDWAVDADTKPDPKRYFVIPPGKWVDSIDDVIDNWDKHGHLGTR